VDNIRMDLGEIEWGNQLPTTCNCTSYCTTPHIDKSPNSVNDRQKGPREGDSLPRTATAI
jgi:hypothetical protein